LLQLAQMGYLEIKQQGFANVFVAVSDLETRLRRA
jgi:hypothetical protein